MMIKCKLYQKKKRKKIMKNENLFRFFTHLLRKHSISLTSIFVKKHCLSRKFFLLFQSYTYTQQKEKKDDEEKKLFKVLFLYHKTMKKKRQQKIQTKS